jgi:threonine/homoserine/homoserine lactone efflux protein
MGQKIERSFYFGASAMACTPREAVFLGARAYVTARTSVAYDLASESSPMELVPLQTALAFFGAAVLLALAPGPDNLFVLVQSALRGRAAGLLVVLGLCSGLLVHTTAVALGLATLFATSALAFNLLKAVGALYLLWLAWNAWRAPPAAAVDEASAAPRAGQLYRRGVVMNVTNPKVSIFFLAFLPQFVAAERGRVGLQVLLLGALFMLATLLVFGAIALAAGTLRHWLLRSPRAQVAMNRVAAVVFVGLATRLALARQ